MIRYSKALWILLLQVSTAWAQFSRDTPNLLDNEGRRHQKWAYWLDANDEVVADSTRAKTYYSVYYEHGEIVGKAQQFDLQNRLIWEADMHSFMPDTVHGEAISYYSDGTKQTVYTYSFGLMEGMATAYYSNGTVKWSCNYTNNYPNGTYAEYYASGKLMRSGPVVEGKKNGLFQFYREDGTLEKECTYVNDVYEGSYRDYDKTGKLLYDYAYVNNKKQGVLVAYTPEGSVKEVYMFWDDQEVDILEVITRVGNNMVAGDANYGLLHAYMLEEYVRIKYGVESPIYAFPVGSIAKYLYFQGRIEEAQPWIVKNFDLVKMQEGTDQEETADGWHLLGLMLTTCNENEKAWEAYRYAIQKSYNKGKATEQTLDYLSRVASLSVTLGNTSTGFAQYDSLLVLCDEFGKNGWPICADACLKYASYLSVHFEAEKALHLLNEKKFLAEKTKQLPYWEYSRAGILMDLNRYEEGMQLYTNLYRQYDRLQDPDLHLDVSRDLATYYQELGQFANAERLWLEVVALSKERTGADSMLYYGRLLDLASYYERVGRTENAIKLSEQVVDYRLRQTLTNSQNLDELFNANLEVGMLVNSTIDLAKLYTEVYRYQDADSLLVQSISVAREFEGDTSLLYARAVQEYASLLIDMERYDEAEKNLLTAIHLSDTYYADINVNGTTWKDNLSELYIRMNRYADALRLARFVLKERESVLPEGHPLLGSSYTRLGSIYSRLQQTDSALTWYQKGMQLQLNRLNESFSVMNAAEQAAFASTFRYAFDVYNALAAQSGSTDAFEQMAAYQMANKSMLLFSGAAARRSFENDPDPQVQQMYIQWLKNGQYFSKLQQSDTVPVEVVDSVKALMDAQEKELILKSGKDVRFIAPANMMEVYSNLKQGDVYVGFLRYPEFDNHQIETWNLGALVVKPGQPVSFHYLCKEENLLRLLERKPGETDKDYIDRLYLFPEFPEDSLYFQGDQLFRLTWEPVWKQLESAGRILFSPDGALNQLNVAAIPTGLSTWACLTVPMQQVAHIARFQESAAAQNKSITLLGGIAYDAPDRELTEALQEVESSNPEYSIPIYASSEVQGTRGDSWKYLPGSLTEVQQVDQILKANGFQLRSYTGSKASEEAFKWNSGEAASEILHIATHGFFSQRSTDNPLYNSGLLLAGGNRSWQGDRPGGNLDDGILTAAEVSYLNLSKTSLVVLSACETGLGQVQANEGVYGLQRAFMLAGVPSILMSMWKVSDAETSLFMQHFYTQMAQGMSYSAAFSATQQLLSRRYSPYYWAAFVLQQ